MHTNNLVLPKLGGAEALSFEAGQAYSNSNLKYKNITDYATAVSSNYQAIRNIQFSVVDAYSKYTWLGTRYSVSSYSSFYINPDGQVTFNLTSFALGVRAAK